jgi:hypothetical protein
MTRSIIAGETDYSKQTLKEMHKDLNDWIHLLDDTKKTCNNIITGSQKTGDWNNIYPEFKDLVEKCIDFINRARNEIEEIVSQLLIEVQDNHVNRISTIGENAHHLMGEIPRVKNREYRQWIREQAPDITKEVYRIYIGDTEKLYDEINGAVLSLWELSNLAERLRSFIGYRHAEPLSYLYNSMNEEKPEEIQFSKDGLTQIQSKDTSERIKLLSGYRKIEWYNSSTQNSEILVFNDRQAKIIEELHKAPDHELHIRTLLHDKLGLRLEKYSMTQQFRDNNDWRKIISKSDKRGFWKLNI